VTDCRFCDIVAGTVPAHVVFTDDVAIGFLDIRPVFKGHVLVAPLEHYVTLADLPADLVGPLFTRVQRVSAAMPAAVGAQGSFVGENNVVSQSVPHLHVHVVPRTKGDGLRGFFWPRTRYADDAEAEDYARRLRTVLQAAELIAVTSRQTAVATSTRAPSTSPVIPPRRRTASTVSASEAASPAAIPTTTMIPNG
jgi:histidine triad (HIT) family protein